MASLRVFIVPSGKGGDHDAVSHTILTLKHPNTDAPTRYLLHHPPASSQPEGSSAPFLYEVLKIANPIHGARSWLITPDMPPLQLPTELAKEGEEKVIETTEGEEEGEKVDDVDEDQGDEQEEAKEEEEEDAKEEPKKGEEKSSLVIKDAHLFLTTPIDPLYLLLSHLASEKVSRNFLSFDDLLEGHPESSTWSKIFKLYPPSEKHLQSRLVSICDTVSVSDEDMYRLSTKKLNDTLISRVEGVAKSLPPSLTKLIKRKLSKPIGLQAATAWKRQTPADTEGGIIDDAELEEEVQQETGETSEMQTDSQEVESQLRREASRLKLNEEEPTSQVEDTQASAVAETQETDVTAAVQINEEALLPSVEIQYLSKLSHAVQFMQNYLPTSIYSSLTSELHTRFPLEPLESYQEELKSLRAAANSALDFSMSHTKRTIEDLEGGVTREDVDREKKRKKKEESAKSSHGVKQLAKVDTKGMMKMTSFFKKKE
ncbi:hypothetical protein ABW20_dc0103929 [Dactylellina cionopaga]|nr:hypothetical protein ABW20_dc0103929 [Dactylellina cionopaga]